MTIATREKQELITFLFQTQALLFGRYTLKSGRVSPYFFNSARFRTGAQLAQLGEYFAAAIAQAAPKATIVFGPAYKGIPLSIAAAMALTRQTGREIGYLFNRKEAKGHGDQGQFVGQTPGPEDRLVLVDDVITDGETKREAVEALRAAFPHSPIDALVIALDRMEQNAQGEDAVRQFESRTGIPVVALMTLSDLEAVLTAFQIQPPPGLILPPGLAGDIRTYRERYGVTRT